MHSWKFSSMPEEINLDRIIREASEAVDDEQVAVRLTIGRQVFTLCSVETWQKRAPNATPLGLVTRLTKLSGEPDQLDVEYLYPVFFANPGAVVLFNQDLTRKLRGAVETKVEVF